MATNEEIREEYRKMAAAIRNGLVECPHCHRMVDPESLGQTCWQGRDVCLDPFDSECPAAFGSEEA